MLLISTDVSTERRQTVPNITPMLWFDGTAEEAAKFYTSTFPNSRIDKVVNAAADNPSNHKGDVMTVEFTLDGSKFVGLNGGPDFKFNEAISFVIDCEDQAEVDRYWTALILGGGQPSQCGWLKDKFGVSWQVIPKQMDEYLKSPDREASRRAFEAMLKMSKLDVEQLREAYEGVPA
jgi:predicted 3-demethylubiquinone-9 3-methyltransferase (glyoxalase superfamily)